MLFCPGFPYSTYIAQCVCVCVPGAHLLAVFLIFQYCEYVRRWLIHFVQLYNTFYLFPSPLLLFLARISTTSSLV